MEYPLTLWFWFGGTPGFWECTCVQEQFILLSEWHVRCARFSMCSLFISRGFVVLPVDQRDLQPGGNPDLEVSLSPFRFYKLTDISPS